MRARIGLAAATVLLLLCPIGTSAAATRPITFYFGLVRPEARARAAFYAVEQPGSSSYRRFLSPARTAARYGASPAVRARFLSAIRRHGFSARIDPSGVFARVTGPMARFARVFKVRIIREVGDAGVVSYGTNGTPSLPADLRPLVRDVVFSYLRQGWLGLAGVGTYASAGDSGSSCNGLSYSGVAWPASSPFVTSVGGTRLTLTAANARQREVVWNDLRWLSSSNGGGAGGGGFASESPRGPYQRGLGLSGDRRAVPDVAAAASTFPGWPAALGGTWLIDSGTSAAAPLVASAMAVLSADLRRRHLPAVGPANGLFYYLAHRRRSAFWDVVRGNNGFFATVPAHVARRGYDLASGLGVPQFAEIARLIPAAGGPSRGTASRAPAEPGTS